MKHTRKNSRKGAGLFDMAKSIASNPDLRNYVKNETMDYLDKKTSSSAAPPPPPPSQSISEEDKQFLQDMKSLINTKGGRRKSKTLRRKFDKCVKAVRKTVKARKGSTKKQAAYAICTASILKEHGRK